MRCMRKGGLLMSLPRMRTAEGVLKELRAADPDTAVSLHFIRGIIAAERIPVVSSGRRKFVDFDKFLDFLASGEATSQEPPKPGVIRRVQG